MTSSSGSCGSSWRCWSPPCARPGRNGPVQEYGRAARCPAIRAASAGVSFDAPFGPRRTGTSPATPQASAWSHRQMVAGSTPNASATWPCDAARSRTSCTAASRRPASSPASQAKAASPCTATSPPSPPASRPTPAAISAAPAGSSGRGSRLSIRAIIHHPARLILTNRARRAGTTRRKCRSARQDHQTHGSMSVSPEARARGTPATCHTCTLKSRPATRPDGYPSPATGHPE